MHAGYRWIAWFAALFALTLPLAAQGTLTLEAAIEPSTAKPGEEVQLVLRAAVAPGWHAYGTRETVNKPIQLPADKLQLGGLVAVGDAILPPGKPKQGPLGAQYPLPANFSVRQKLAVPPGAEAGPIEVRGVFGYQLCTESRCLGATSVEFTAKVTIEAGAGIAAPKPVEGQAAEGEAPGNAAGSTPGATEANELTTKPGLVLEPDPVDEPKLTLVAKFDRATVRAGEPVTLVLTATVVDGYHAYGTRNTAGTPPVALPKEQLQHAGLEAVGDPEVPPGEPVMQFGEQTFQLPKVFEVKQRFRVPEGTKPGNLTASGRLDYSVCDDNSCDPPAVADFSATLTVEAGPALVAAGSGGGDGGGGGIGGSWWALVIACIGGGLFALAMPCTYPMIPITFSFFTKQAEKRGGNVMTLAVIYGLGIVAMFVVVGSLLSTVIIGIVNHWATNAVIGVLFFFFAFVLFGWINLEPPQAVQRAAGKASATGGLLGVFFMGATLVITSFTCTAPIVGSLLAKVATYGTFRVAVGMAVFGLTMAVPFVFLALAPGKVKALPRSGEWMETLKVSLGFVELAAAFKFVSMVDFAFGWQALPRELFLLLWTAIFAMWAMYLFGILRKAGSPNEGVGAGRMASGMAVTLLATYFLFGAMGNRLDSIMTGFIPGYSNSLLSKADGKATKHQVAHVVVPDDGEQAMRVAKEQDKLLLYNFTGFN